MHYSFSRRWGIMDFRVWLSFIIVALLSLGFMGYKIATDVQCPKTTLAALGKLNHTGGGQNVFFINEEISFSADVDNKDFNDKIEWNFGDNTPVLKGPIVSHVYTTAGSYLVTAILNGVCKESFTIRITDGTLGLHISNAPVINPIVSADVMNVGDENSFNSTLPAKSYSWNVLELPALGVATDASAKFVFPTAGTYTVKLVLDGVNSYTKIIQVVDPSSTLGKSTPLPPVALPDVPPPPPVVADLPPVVTQKEEVPVKQEEPPKVETPVKPQKSYELLPLPAIQAMLEDVTEGKKDVDDFNNQLCNGAGTKVVANDKPTTFAALCMDLKKKKRKLVVFKKEKSIQSLKVVRDENNGNCITLMYVNYK